MGQNICGSSNKLHQNQWFQIQATESGNLALQNLQQTDQNFYPLRKWLDKNNLNTFSVNALNKKSEFEKASTISSAPQCSISMLNKKKDCPSDMKASLQRYYMDPIKQNVSNQRQNMRKSSTGSNYSPIQINIESFISVKKQKISENYQILQQIGQGSFGNVYIAKCRSTGQLRAIKSLKQRYMDEEQKKSLFNEIDILRKLDHPNIIKLYEVYIWNNFFYVVMQYCQGGSVLNSITKKQTYSQTTVSIIMKQLFSAVSYLHAKGIVHRDLKLENMVFQKKIELKKHKDFNIKIIDFGLAVDLFKCKNKKNQIAGTKNYMSPEAFKGQLTSKNDVWSCGIIFVILLTGKNPFSSPHLETMIQNIKQKDIFSEPIWKKLSQGANDLAFNLLKKNHQKRITAQKALKHEWIVSNSEEKQKMLNSVRHRDSILTNLASYERGDNFVAVIRSFLAFKRINQQQKEQLTNLFQSLDKDHSGMIENKELLQCYLNIAGQQNPKHIEDIIKKIDFNNSGKIDFSEFLTATYNKKKLLMTEALRQAFNHYDVNKSGYLQLRQIKQILLGSSTNQINQIFRAIDTNDDNLISFEEFAKYLQKNWA